MSLSVEAFDRAFSVADNINHDGIVPLFQRLGLDAELLTFLYRHVAGPEQDEDRLATYLLGLTTTLLAMRQEQSAMIQRMPGEGDRWRGLSDQDLKDVVVALESDVSRYTHATDRQRVDRLWRDGDAEITRRGAQPQED